MDNHKCVHDENIPLVHDEDRDNDHGGFNAPNTSIKEIAFTDPNSTETTSTLPLIQKVKRGKLAALYRHLVKQVIQILLI